MIFNEIRFALRSLLKTPGFTAVAIIVLALGIGANAAVFTIVNATVIRPTPGESGPEPVVGLYSRDKTKPGSYRSFSYPDYRDIRARNPIFSDMAAMSFALVGYTEGDRTRRVFSGIIRSN